MSIPIAWIIYLFGVNEASKCVGLSYRERRNMRRDINRGKNIRSKFRRYIISILKKSPNNNKWYLSNWKLVCLVYNLVTIVYWLIEWKLFGFNILAHQYWTILVNHATSINIDMAYNECNTLVKHWYNNKIYLNEDLYLRNVPISYSYGQCDFVYNHDILNQEYFIKDQTPDALTIHYDPIPNYMGSKNKYFVCSFDNYRYIRDSFQKRLVVYTLKKGKGTISFDTFKNLFNKGKK